MLGENIDLVLKFIDALRRRLKRNELLVSICYLLSLVAFALLFGVVGDHAVGFPVFARFLFLALFCTGSVAFLYVAVVRPLVRRLSNVYCARIIEKRLTNLKGNLNALVELPEKSGPVAEALAERSLQQLENVTPVDFVPIKPVFRALGFLAISLMLFSAYATFSSKSTFDSILRLFMPSSALAIPTSTRITEISPGDKKILIGSQVLFRIRTDGDEPNRASLVRIAGDREEEISVIKTAPSLFEGLLPSVIASFEYYVTAGDAYAGPYKITVLPVPAISDVQFIVTPPSYTGEEPWTSQGPSLRIIKGSLVRAMIATSTPISSANILMASVPSKMPLVNSKTAYLEWQPERNTSLAFFYTDTEGFRSEYSRVYNVELLEDKPPIAVIKLPLHGTAHSVDVPLDLIGTVSDDFGLSEVRARWTCNASEWHSDEIPVSGRSVEVRMKFVPANMGWNIGDEVTFAIYARDNHEPEGNEEISTYVTVKMVKPGNSEVNRQNDNPDKGRTEPKLEEDEPSTPEEVEKKLDEMKEEDKDALEDAEKKVQPDKEETEKPDDNKGNEKEDEPKLPERSPSPSQSPTPTIPPSGSLSPGSTRTGTVPSQEGSRVPEGSPIPTGSSGSSAPSSSGSPVPGNTDKEQPVNSPSATSSPQPGTSGSPSPGASSSPSTGTPSSLPASPSNSGAPNPDASQQPTSPQVSASPSPDRSGTTTDRPANPEQSPVPSQTEQPSGSPTPSSGQPGTKTEGENGDGKSGTDESKDNGQDGGKSDDTSKPPDDKGDKKDGVEVDGEKNGDKEDGTKGKDGEDKAAESKGGESSGGATGNTEKGKSDADKLSDLIDAIDKAIAEGKITEAELEKMGLSRDRIDEYKKLLRLRKILALEVKGSRDANRNIESGDSSGGVGAHGPKTADSKDKTSEEAKRSTEKVTGGYRELIDAFRKSLEKK